MAERMTFPMYAIHRQQTQALWQAVQSLLDERGVMVAGDPPAADPGDLLAHWRQPTLLLSQTCGYPLVTQLPEVQTVGCFHYAAPGCEGRRYRSLLVVREADSHRMLGDFFGRRAVCNAEHSQSGYNVLRKMVAPLSREGRFFSAVMFSGSHRQSLRELQQENADIAAIDCVTYAEEAELLSPLVFLRCTPLTRADTAIREFAQRLYRPDAAEESLNQLMADLLLRMPYSPGATQVQDSAADAFARAKGVCQDHTHVFLACCRALEIPARYVSGYVYSDNAQHVAMHAWAEVWLDGRWLSFDITNNTRRLNQHLRLATGLDYLDACPVRGTRLGGGGEIMLTNAEVREHSQQAQQQ
ncbi:phosphate/phosphonate ABC transporter periplasmic protein [Klebsiella pneumoniae]|nr:phosphate/phosphonate ABC transporter periplasmic protein [Klebsiella pneumoniae]